MVAKGVDTTVVGAVVVAIVVDKTVLVTVVVEVVVADTEHERPTVPLPRGVVPGKLEQF